MPNTIFSQDKPGSLQLRNDTRPQHRGCLATKANVLLAAGPLMADDKSGVIGSLTVLDTEERAVAVRFAEAGRTFRSGYARASGCVGGNRPFVTVNNRDLDRSQEIKVAAILGL